MRCVLILKNIWLWAAVGRKSKELIASELGTRDTEYFENLSERISHVDPKKHVKDSLCLS